MSASFKSRCPVIASTSDTVPVAKSSEGIGG
jgi:hypothetical protein